MPGEPPSDAITGSGRPGSEQRTVIDSERPWHSDGATEFAAPTTVQRADAGASSNDGELAAGTRIDQYEVIRELGRGGMGRVVLARDTILGRRVALKFLSSTSASFTERFLSEARTTAQVTHENIVVIHEVREIAGTPYMVLEYLEGQPLSHAIGSEQLSATRAVELIVPVVRALARAHEFDIVHRDLKPDNIFVTEAGVIKVLDFGIAKLFSDKRRRPGRETGDRLDGVAPLNLTSQGAIVGTLPYMAPEQWGDSAIDGRADLWAVGIILYEMLTGQHPLGSITRERLLYSAATLDEALPGVGELRPDLPGALVDVVDRCLEKHRDRRFSSADELLEALTPLLPGRLGRRLAEGENPFPGLVAFQEEDANRFFGRTRDTVRVVKRIRERPLIGLVGPSGVGKSSLVRAGVVPNLKCSGERWETVVIRPGRNPIETLARVTATLADADESAPELIPDLIAGARRVREEPGHLGLRLRDYARRHACRVLLFVDQFEELYTLVDARDERLAFTQALAAIADDPSSPLRVVVSMRSDFLDRAGEDQQFFDALSEALVFLQRPGRDGLREALERPVEMVGYRFESPALLLAMLGELEGTPGALPLLQFAAAKLWDERDPSRKMLTRAAYDGMGGVAGTLATHADEVLLALSPEQRLLVRELFLRLVTSDGTRAIADVSDLRELAHDPAVIEDLVQALVQRRLLVVQTGDDERAAVAIVHESLITAWPRLRQWLDDSQEDTAFLEQLRTTARQWERAGRSAGLLWRGEALDEARRFERRYSGELARGEREYLTAVLDLGRRSTRRRRAVVTTAFAVLLALLGGAALALFKISASEEQALVEREAAVAAQKRERTEAERALKAESTVRAQLEQLKSEQAKTAAAEKRARSGEKQVEMTREELKEALTEARKNRDLARGESQKAQREAARAQKSAAAEREAKQKFQRLFNEKKAELAKEKARSAKIRTGRLE